MTNAFGGNDVTAVGAARGPGDPDREGSRGARGAAASVGETIGMAVLA